MIAGLILIAVAVLYRLLPALLGYTVTQPEWLPNFSPMAALVLCGAALLPRRLAISVPFIALIGTDLILNSYYGYALVDGYLGVKVAAFALIAAFAWQLRPQARASVLFPAAFGASLFFYVATNTASWLYNPGYIKSLTGWTQALTTGIPGHPPTWTFFRNALVSDLLFTALFLLCVSRRTAPADAPESAKLARW